MEKKTMAGLIVVAAIVAVLIFAGFTAYTEDFSTAKLTHENVTNAVEGSLGKEVDVSIYGLKGGGNCVRITRPWKGYNTEEMTKSFARDSVDALEVLFSNPQVDKVVLAQDSEFPGINIQVTFTRKTADRIDWDNLAQSVSTDYTKLFDAADSHHIGYEPSYLRL